MNRAVVALRREPSPCEARVLAAMWDAPSYKVLAARIGSASATVRLHVANVARLLPDDWFPHANTKSRVEFYAQRCYALAADDAAQNEAA